MFSISQNYCDEGQNYKNMVSLIKSLGKSVINFYIILTVAIRWLLKVILVKIFVLLYFLLR